MTGVIDVAAVDDHPLVLDSMAGWVMGAEGGIRVVGTAPTVGDLLAGPGRAADVVLLDLDLDDGSTVERNVADILAAGPVVLVLSASDKPVAVRAAMRAGTLGYVLKNEQTGQIRAAIKAVPGAGPREICARRARCADEIGPVSSSRRGRASPATSLAAVPPHAVRDPGCARPRPFRYQAMYIQAAAAS